MACGSSEVVEAMMNDLTYKESLVGKFSSAVARAIRPFLSTQVLSHSELPILASSPQFTGSKLLQTTLANLLMDVSI